MIEPPTSEQIDELVAGYVLGNLDDVEAEAFQQLLVQYPHLSTQTARLQEVLGLLPYSLPEVKPPPTLRISLLQAAALTTDPASSSNPQRFEPLVRFFGNVGQQRLVSWRFALSGGVMLLAIALGFTTLRLRYQLQIAQTQLDQQAEMLAGLPDSSDGVTMSTSLAFLMSNWDGLELLLQDHTQAISQANELVDISSSQPKEIIQQLQELIPPPNTLPVLTAESSNLLGGSFCQFDQTKGVRFTYRIHSDQTLSLYQLHLSVSPAFPLLSSDRLYINPDQGPSLVIWGNRDFLYAIVVDLPPEELHQLANSISQI